MANWNEGLMLEDGSMCVRRAACIAAAANCKAPFATSLDSTTVFQAKAAAIKAGAHDQVDSFRDLLERHIRTESVNCSCWRRSG